MLIKYTGNVWLHIKFLSIFHSSRSSLFDSLQYGTISGHTAINDMFLLFSYSFYNFFFSLQGCLLGSGLQVFGNSPSWGLQSRV